MKHKIVLFVLLFAVLPLVSATELHLNAYYDAGDLVEISGSCSDTGKDVGIQLASSYETLFVDQIKSTSSFSTSYRLSDSAAGTYTVYAVCDGESKVSKQFTIGTPTIDDDDDTKSRNGRQFVGEGLQCNNKIDDDGDKLVDYPADPGCSSPDDNSESDNIIHSIERQIKESVKDSDARSTDVVPKSPDKRARFSIIWLIMILVFGGILFWLYATGHFSKYRM